VDPGPALERRIAKRVDEMLDSGWTDEVRSLSATVPHGAVAWKACGYERLRDALESGEPLAQVCEKVRTQVVIETRQYARRQRTWFRRQLKHGPVTLVDPERDDALERAHAWWEGGDIA
jgi:tRNA dimethylallyltransferase